MKTLYRSALCALALAAPGWTSHVAAEPPAASAKGHILVLDNDKVYEGDIERVGDRYRIRRALKEGESWVPCSQALRLCDSMADAFAYLRSRANLNDPDERLRLAQWCHLHEMPAQAVLEVKAAYDLRPDHEETKRLFSRLQQTAGLPAPAPQSAPPAHTEPIRELPPAELDAESLSQFVTHVQPVLMNSCASCHGAGHGGGLHLTRVYGVVPASRSATQQNLSAVLAQMSMGHPSASPLLSKALTAHWSGENTQPPFTGRQAPPYRVLEEWVARTIAHNPQLAQRLRNVDPASSKGQVSMGPENPAPKAASEPLSSLARDEFARLNTSSSSGSATLTGTVQPRELPPNVPPVAALAGPVDAFDPVIFNRQMHGNKKN
jgi:hypothetical protein